MAHGHSHSHAHIHGNGTLNKRATLFAVIMASALALLKLYAWIETDSLSIFSSLVDSSLDITTSVINMLAVGYALKPADEDHPYGHDSIEDIVGLVQASFIFCGACFILYEGFQRFLNPVEIQESSLGIYVMLISIAATVALIIYQKIVIKKTKSLVVESDSMHYVSDVLSGALIIISLYFTRNTSLSFIDPLLALGIAIYITISAYQIGRRAFDNLMDKEISQKDKEKIIEIINENKKHKGFHDFKSRSNGNKFFIQFDLEMDGNLTLKQAHDISAEVMEAITRDFPNAEVTIHFDPENDQNHH